jgi:hypothetical protein
MLFKISQSFYILRLSFHPFLHFYILRCFRFWYLENLKFLALFFGLHPHWVSLNTQLFRSHMFCWKSQPRRLQLAWKEFAKIFHLRLSCIREWLAKLCIPPLILSWKALFFQWSHGRKLWADCPNPAGYCARWIPLFFEVKTEDCIAP